MKKKNDLIRKAFLEACRYGSLEVVKYLVNTLKCDIHVKDDDEKKWSHVGFIFRRTQNGSIFNKNWL